MWIKRDAQARIVEVLRWPPQDRTGYEEVPEDHPDLVARREAEADAAEALAARLAIDAEERLQAKLDAAVMALVNATPEQLLTYARNNFPSLSLAEQNRLGAILHILAVAVRPTIR